MVDAMQKDPPDPLPPPDSLIEEALHWLVLLRDEDATDEDRRRFAAWLSRSPAHESAWARARQVWTQADVVAPAIRGRALAPPADAARPDPGHRRLSRRAWMRAAAVAAVATAAGDYLLTRPGLFADYRTAVAERRPVHLPDGSVAELGSATALSVAFGEDTRRTRLHAGEAFFTVAAEPDRPFTVEAGDGVVRALGTSFNVKRSAESVTVSAVRHAVAVTVGGNSLTLAQGNEVRYGPGGLGPVGRADLAAVLAWRRDRLIFRDAPLRDVVAELERYRHGRIFITDGRIAAIPVTAVFNAHQIDDALRTITDTLPIRVTRATDFLVFLSPAG